MGNDGGSIPHRREVVKHKQKEEVKEKYALAKSKASYCAISKEPLRKPVVVCRLGLLYNKEEIIKRLLEKSIPNAFRHVKKLKDVKEAKVETKDSSSDSQEPIRIICPLTQRDFNGFNKFLMNWGCGCVFSEEAATELKMTDKCLVCGESVENKADTISLNQTPEEQQVFLKQFDAKVKELEDKKSKKKNGKKRTDREDDKKEEEEPVDKKRQKTELSTEDKLKQSEAYKSLFSQQYEENKDTDFLCRCVHRGLR